MEFAIQNVFMKIANMMEVTVGNVLLVVRSSGLEINTVMRSATIRTASWMARIVYLLRKKTVRQVAHP